MSVEELRSRIQELSSEIDIQKKLLKKLEHDKILAQRQLNAVVDPVARLPLEISSEIFVQSLASIAQLGARHIPMLLLNICHAWTNIALSTPSLWAAIDVVFPRTGQFKEFLDIWLRRARNQPLSISFRGELDGDDISAIFGVLWGYGPQLKHLEICDGNVEANVFGNITPGPLPLLETLTIRRSFRGFSGSQILELLRLAPSLIECMVNDVTVCRVMPVPEKLVLPNLHRLLFGPCTGKPDSDDDLLNGLTLPGLEILSVPLYRVSDDDLLSFLQRSSPPLQELFIAGGFRPIHPARLQDCLLLVPTLTRFEMWWPKPTLVEELFTALADSSFLPNLRNLTIHNLDDEEEGFGISDSSWATLLSALSARRNRLRVLHLAVLDEDPPAVDVLASMKELAADGMQLYIGTTYRNFIVV